MRYIAMFEYEAGEDGAAALHALEMADGCKAPELALLMLMRQADGNRPVIYTGVALEMLVDQTTATRPSPPRVAATSFGFTTGAEAAFLEEELIPHQFVPGTGYTDRCARMNCGAPLHRHEPLKGAR